VLDIEIHHAQYDGTSWTDTNGNGEWTIELGYLTTDANFTSISNATTMSTDNLVISDNVKGYNPDTDKMVLRMIPTVAGTDTMGNILSTDVLPCIKSIMLYKYYPTVDSNGNPTYAKPGVAVEIEPVVTYIAYELVYGASGKEVKEICTWKQGESAPSNLRPIMTDYSAVRHINVKESNYFNIANELAELFGRWVQFKVKHRRDGRILLDANGKATKTVEFTQYHGNDYLSSAGFKYGINEKGIKRTNDSKSLVTKLIVRDNMNEHADNGICSIKTARDNPTCDSYIYNFNYYINHGLLQQNEVMDDLYGLSGTGTFNYYDKVSDIMKLYAPIEQELVAAEGALTAAKSGIETSNVMITKAEQEIEQKKYLLQESLKNHRDY
jgi:hypothetical protein